ncbi:MAG TPA: serine/threonine-protein kinase [Ktedonobacteraceae bacterium]|nr:serine/threonine-protein kinase [Ktedonobacteraceae bacterium]
MNAEALIGTVLGTSTLQQLIGQGGMGAVYLAQQSRPRRQVAVKVLMPATSLKPHQLAAFLERFRRETDAAASLEHPNIMPVYEYGERGGLAYLVMPYISAGTLRDVMERDVQMSFTEAVKYLEQMAAALDFAHARGVIHRDIKPANMLLTPDGRLLLTDFGLVKILSDNHSEQMRLTGAGAPVGTPDYMSPEQVIGSEVDGRADQYSLGVVLFQMLTGTTPFQGETPMQIASQQLHMQPPAPRLLRPDLPEAAERVLLRAMAKRPDERFKCAQEFASAFRAALVEQPYQADSSQNTSALRKGSGLFDPKWQSTGTMPSFSSSQFNTSTLGSTASTASFAAQAEAPRPAGTGLLSKTGFFPRIGLNENTGAFSTTGTSEIDPAVGFFSTGQVPVPNGTPQMSFGQDATSGFSTEPTFQPTSLQQSFFAQSHNVAQQPFPTSSLQQLSPAAQSTTSALSLFTETKTGGGNTIKLTGPVKVVQVPVAPGQYVTGLLPVQREVANPISEPPVKRSSKLQKVMLAIAALVLLVGGVGGGTFLLRSHNTTTAGTPGSITNAPNTAATSIAQATATAGANIIFSDSLSQNIHNFPTGTNGPKQYAFKDGAYHIINQGNNGVAVVVQESFPQTRLGYQITMQEIKGDDTSPTNTFGVILRYNEQVNKGNKVDTFYTFEILNNNGNSQYSFYKYDSSKSVPWIPIVKSMKTGKEFHGGHGQNAVNTVRVFADGKSFTFYVNGQKVGTAQDGSLPSGSMGMLVNLKGTEVAFTNMLITQN